MKTRIATLFLLLLTATAYGESDVTKPKLDLELIASKKDVYFSYQLYQTPISGNRWNLVLVIKNTGAKFINLKGDRKPFTTIKDSKGNKLKIVEESEAVGIAHQSFGVIHISALPPKNLKASYTLELKSANNLIEYFHVVVPGIRATAKKQAQQGGASDR